MKKLIAALLAAITLSAILFAAGCADSKNKVFIPDDKLRASAEEVLASLGRDGRIDEYLKIRPSIEKYQHSTRKSYIESELDELKKAYSGIDIDLSFANGAKQVNDQLFNYLIEGAYYDKAELVEILPVKEPSLKETVVSLGYKLIYVFQNNGYRIGTKYYFGNGNVHDDLNYYSICALENGDVEYVSLPVYYEPLTEQFVESYSSKNAEERAVVFDESVKYFAENANVCENAVLNLIYSEDELNSLQAFFNGLDVKYLDANNLVKEEEPYSNRQIAVELGDTRFILRITIYGMFMDVIQNKDYYHGSFYAGLETLRRAYLGSEATNVNDEKYIVIG